MPHPRFARTTFTPHHCSHCSSKSQQNHEHNPRQRKCMLDICITASSPSLAPRARARRQRHRLVHSEAASA
eukprot:1569619-Prymnesium_polylepis.1